MFEIGLKFNFCNFPIDVNCFQTVFTDPDSLVVTVFRNPNTVVAAILADCNAALTAMVLSVKQMECLAADETRDHFLRGPNRTLAFFEFLDPFIKIQLTVISLVMSIPDDQVRNVEFYLLCSVLAINILNFHPKAKIGLSLLQKTFFAVKNEIISKYLSIFVRIHFQSRNLVYL